MIFDFKDQLNIERWDQSQLVVSPPKTFNDYYLFLKSLLISNLFLAIPFVFVLIASESISLYSNFLQTKISKLQDAHDLYQERRTLILEGKRNVDSNISYISSIAPFIVDSIYPNLFLSFLTPILSVDSSISELSISRDSSSIRVTSNDPDPLSYSFSTLDQHPLVQSTDISFTSIKASNDSTQQVSQSGNYSSEIEIKFSYNYPQLTDLMPLFSKADMKSLQIKSSLFK